MTAAEVLAELKSLGSDSYKRILLNHCVQEPCYGVKIEYLKRIVKRVKVDYRLALDLYDTGVYDAMYLAGLIADDQRMTRKDLARWLAQANCAMLVQYTVPWVAAGSRYGRELALEWIESTKEGVAVAGWATLGCIASIKSDSALDLVEYKRLLERIGRTIHDQPDRVRYVMNGFVIGVGSYVKALTSLALQIAAKIGKVTVDMGDTACKVPDAAIYIKKVQANGGIGKKRKSAKC